MRWLPGSSLPDPSPTLGLVSLVVVFFSTRGGKRGVLISAVALVALSVSACSSGDPSVGDAKSADPSAARAVEEEAAIDTYQKFWDILIAAQNSGEVKSSAFEGIATGTFVEARIKRIRDYRDQKIRRVGEPEFSAFEASVNDDRATVTACFNEDEWGFERDGQSVEVEKKGSGPVGTQLERSGDGWIMTELLEPDTITKDCS